MKVEHVFNSDKVLLECRAWIITRQDGVRLGFTDHDCAVMVDGLCCEPDSGFETTALETSSGLSVDNAEVLGALRSDRISEDDLDAGLYQSAEVTTWVLNWQRPETARILFRGKIGEIERTGKAFRAEILSLSDALNVPMGRVYQSKCDAVLGDQNCGVDLSASGFSAPATVLEAISDIELVVSFDGDHPEGWFERGTLSGADALHSLRIKRDRVEEGRRILTLWEAKAAGFDVSTNVVLRAGCDKCLSTCRDKFSNVVNFRGFPFIPGEDWLATYPNSDLEMNGGKR